MSCPTLLLRTLSGMSCCDVFTTALVSLFLSIKGRDMVNPRRSLGFSFPSESSRKVSMTSSSLIFLTFACRRADFSECAARCAHTKRNRVSTIFRDIQAAPLLPSFPARRPAVTVPVLLACTRCAQERCTQREQYMPIRRSFATRM